METWLLNETLSNQTTLGGVLIDFVSNGQRFVSIAPPTTDHPAPLYREKLLYWTSGDIAFVAYDVSTNTWTNQVYRTVTFDDPLDLTTPIGQWFSANAVKQQTNITLDLSTIGLSVGTHSIQMKLSDDGVTKVDSALSNAVSYVVPDPTPQLSTPANLTADGTTISFDEVENAEKYEVFADGTSIGEYEVPSSETWVLNMVINASAGTTFNAQFTSNGENFNQIRIVQSFADERDVYYDSTYIANGDGGGIFVPETRRTLIFITPTTGELRTWLDTNAVKQ